MKHEHKRLDVNQQAYLAFANAANPSTPSPAPTPGPTASPGPPVLPAGAKLYFGTALIQQASSAHDDPLGISGPVLPVGYRIVDQKNGRSLQATDKTGPLSLAMFIPRPVPTVTPNTAPASGTVSSASTPLPQNSNDSVVSVSLTPVPLPMAVPGTRATVGFLLTALQPGRASVLIDSSEGSCWYDIAVVPGNAQKHLVFSGGIGGSNIPSQTNVAVTPSPQPSSGPGQYIYHTEHSDGQTFVPILANYRVTDWASAVQLYLSGGIAASGNSGKALFGLSLGMNDQAFLTAGWHSSTVDQLQPGIIPNGFTPFTAFPAGTAPTFSQRTTRPFLSITFPLCSVTSIFSGLTGSAPCATPTPAPTATPSPTPQAPAKSGG
ncbi:MAG TPA: hypothetical protein VGC72_16920 [Candidatus Elarobacter sp.]|jgi:hypothetical protein